MLMYFLIYFQLKAPNTASPSSTYFSGKSFALSRYCAFSLLVILSKPYRVRYRPTTILFSSSIFLLSPRRWIESGVLPQSYLMLVYLLLAPLCSISLWGFAPRSPTDSQPYWFNIVEFFTPSTPTIFISRSALPSISSAYSIFALVLLLFGLLGNYTAIIFWLLGSRPDLSSNIYFFALR